MTEPGRLFESLHKRLKIRLFRPRLHQRMQMIGHQAVRKKRKLEMIGVVQKLRRHIGCD